MNTVKSVSISNEQAQFCDDMDLSCSKLLQDAIETAKENFRISDKFVQELQRKISFLQNTIDKQRNFIEDNNLMEQFMNKAF